MPACGALGGRGSRGGAMRPRRVCSLELCIPAFHVYKTAQTPPLSESTPFHVSAAHTSVVCDAVRALREYHRLDSRRTRAFAHCYTPPSQTSARSLARGSPHSARRTLGAMPAVALALRGLFAGAGSAMMSSSLVVDAVLELTGKADPRDVRLLYLGKLGTNAA